MPCIFICFADEWANFLERIGRGESSEEDFKESSSDTLELRFWVSYRGQTLARTGEFVVLFMLLSTEYSYLGEYM
jgi:callose synthase